MDVARFTGAGRSSRSRRRDKIGKSLALEGTGEDTKGVKRRLSVLQAIQIRAHGIAQPGQD